MRISEFVYLNIQSDPKKCGNSWSSGDSSVSSFYFRTNNYPLVWNAYYSLPSKIHHWPNSSPDPSQRNDLRVEWAGKALETKIPLISSTTESDRTQAWWPKSHLSPASPHQEASSLYPGGWKEKKQHPLISLMGYCFLCEWMAEHETAQQELHASEMRQKHKSIPCLKITLLRIETETHTQACAYSSEEGHDQMEKPLAQ